MAHDQSPSADGPFGREDAYAGVYEDAVRLRASARLAREADPAGPAESDLARVIESLTALLDRLDGTATDGRARQEAIGLRIIERHEDALRELAK